MKVKIIDILNKMADGTLKDGFKFEYKGESYTYNKHKNSIFNDESGDYLGEFVALDIYFLDEVEVIEDVKEIEEIQIIHLDDNNTAIFIFMDKINELVRAVNELRKDKNDV